MLTLATLGCTTEGNPPQNSTVGSAEQTSAESASSAVPAQDTSEEPVAQVAKQLSPSVVQVNVKGIPAITPSGPQSEEGIGSGVIYRKDGYIITNNHVAQGARQVNVAFADGSTAQADVVAGDEYTDVAVIRVNRNDLPAAQFDTNSNLIAGQLAVAIGSPQGFQSTVTSGVISGLHRELPAQLTDGQRDTSLVDLIQTSAPISPGSSGGALADRSGEVIGITVAYLPPNETGAEAIGFAIPSDTATSVAEQLIDNGRAAHPYLGISLVDLTPDVASQFGLQEESGALVAEVQSNGPADHAGIKTQDVITAVDSKKVKTGGDLLSALRNYKPGDAIELTVIRGGNESTVDVTLGDRQSAR
ncbi:MAG: trypsin-like peptidase domain-containing protein [Rubrobacter sp.]|nr:trypsin-like peptidase domain-containing protein [Rubrobacter sp.]